MKMHQSEEIFAIMLRVIRKSAVLMATPRHFGTEDLLYSSEIHMIDVIGRQPGICVTEIACRLQITKGAVPKMIRKLLQKGMIERYQAKENKKMVLFCLTNKGHIAFQSHMGFHEALDKKIMHKFDKLPEAEACNFQEILQDIENYIDTIK
jgi:DNA-binding MarR family transcriptional regulator